MTATHALPAELTVYAAAALHAQFRAWSVKLGKSKRARGATFEVDASAVLEIDGCGVQLLVSLSHSVATRQRRLQLANPSNSLRTACELLGLAALLLAPAAGEKP